MRASILSLVVVVACASSHNATKPDGPPACSTAAQCTVDLPRCSPDTMTCAACVGDGDCTQYAGTPHCGTSGACVACADDSQCANPTPACDGMSHSCRASALDSECSSAACNLDDGRC